MVNDELQEEVVFSVSDIKDIIEDEEDVLDIDVSKNQDLLQFVKTEIKEKSMYIDDIDLTSTLISEIKEREKYLSENITRDGCITKIKGPSNILGEWFIKVTDRMLTRYNFRGYSDNYKDEFKSNAYLFFARYWWKFNPERVTQNWTTLPKKSDTTYIWINESTSETPQLYPYYTSNSGELVRWEKTLKSDTELKGGFSYFTILAWTAALNALKVLKENDQNRKHMAESLVRTSENDINTDFYTSTNFTEY